MSSSPEVRSLPFRGATLDRAVELRHQPERMAELLACGAALAVAAADGEVVVDQAAARLARLPWTAGSPSPDGAIVLGTEDGRPLVLVSPAEIEAGLADPGLADPGRARLRRVSLRDAGLTLEASESGLAAYAVALGSWHARHGFCSVCGQRSQVTEAGLARRCPACGASHFPRTDPVAIMSVEHDGRLLMGSRTGWPDDRYSVLAGFVSSGETPEEAVVREVAEESGIVVRDPIYLTSQPWPFPASLMLGYHAVSDGGDPAPGADGELSNVRWFTRDEVVAMQHGTSDLQLPGKVSIARWLIDRWVERGAG